mmetsp:Transcript_28737/g.32853  ORF Transcript_28737/g.32853 Transcript_28737/m.32853 type:complete len:106 (-) Transcript_28737:28-345(-)
MAPNHDLILVLGSVILTKDMKHLIAGENIFCSTTEERKHYLNKVDETHDVFYKFSLRKFKTLAHQPEFSRVFEHYKSSVDLSQLDDDTKIGFRLLSEECGSHPAD